MTYPTIRNWAACIEKSVHVRILQHHLSAGPRGEKRLVAHDLPAKVHLWKTTRYYLHRCEQTHSWLQLFHLTEDCNAIHENGARSDCHIKSSSGFRTRRIAKSPAAARRDGLTSPNQLPSSFPLGRLVVRRGCAFRFTLKKKRSKSEAPIQKSQRKTAPMYLIQATPQNGRANDAPYHKGGGGREVPNSIHLVFPMGNGNINGDLQGSNSTPNSIYKGFSRTRNQPKSSAYPSQIPS